MKGLGLRGNPGLKGRLLESSIEAYVMSLETINRLSIKYRVETFTYLICNAWELMLKAKIIADVGNKNAIYFKKQPGKPRRSLPLRDCLKRTFADNDPTRRNVELIADLRDEATHLVMSQVPKDVLALFQACVLNYHKCLYDWWGISLSDRVPVGMMTIVYDLNPEQLDLSNSRLRKKLGTDTADYLAEFQSQVQREFEELGEPAEFSIGIDYSLVLTKKPKGADIALTTGEDGAPTRAVEVPKNPDKTHPYRRKDLVREVNRELEGECQINPHDIHCIRQTYNIDNNPAFFYQSGVQGSPQYSRAFVEWIAKKYRQDNKFFTKARKQPTT